MSSNNKDTDGNTSDESPLKVPSPLASPQKNIKQALEAIHKSGPLTRSSNKEANSSSSANQHEEVVVIQEEEDKENEQQLKKKGTRRLSAPAPETSNPKRVKIDTSAPTARMDHTLASTLLKSQKLLSQDNFSFELLRQENKILSNKLDKTFERVKNIISLQDAKPEWIVSSQGILTAINSLIKHQSCNYHQNHALNEKCRGMLEHLNNTDLFRGRHEDVMAKLDTVWKALESHDDRLNLIEQHLLTIRNQQPSAHDPYLGYPSNSLPLPQQDKPQERREKQYCVLCQTHTHNVEDCRTYQKIGDKLTRARAISLCTRCLEKFEPDDQGLHAGCPQANTACEVCKQGGFALGVSHHPLFCPFNDHQKKQQTPRAEQKNQSGKARGNGNQKEQGKRN